MNLQIVRKEPARPMTFWLQSKQRTKLAELQRRTGLSASCIARAALDALGDVVIVESVDDLTQEGERDE
jgi:hypothetical protein